LNLKHALEKRFLYIKNVFSMYTVKISQGHVYAYAHNTNLLGGVEHKYQRVQHKNSSIGESKETGVYIIIFYIHNVKMIESAQEYILT